MAGELKMEMNEFLPLREVVFNTLRSAILRGTLAPGERLMELTLADRLGVSRTPVREAIRMLEHEGLVIMRPRRGAQVANITVQELNDVLEVRKSLEILAIEKACERMPSADMDEMERAAAAFEELAADDSSDLTALAESDEAFHDFIYRGTGNQRLIRVLANLREQMYRFRVEYLKDEDIRKDLTAEHRAILEAVRKRSAAEAVALISKHIDNQQKAIYDSIQNADKEATRS